MKFLYKNYLYKAIFFFLSLAISSHAFNTKIESNSLNNIFMPAAQKITTIIEVYDQYENFLGIVLTERTKEPYMLEIPPGIVQYEEHLRFVTNKEKLEKMNLKFFKLIQPRPFFDYNSEIRHRQIAITHIVRTFLIPEINDNKSIEIFIYKLDEIPFENISKYQHIILKNYIKMKNKGKKNMSSILDQAPNFYSNISLEEKVLEINKKYNFSSKENEIISSVMNFVKAKLEKEATGHDFFHAFRVWKNAVTIADIEGGNMFLIQIAALMHDIADWKFNDGDLNIGASITRDFLLSLDLKESHINSIADIIKKISFKGANVDNPSLTIEGQIVQDADRLDALGAIGIARTFAYGGYKNREIYNPYIKPVLHDTFEKYKNSAGPALNHFYEKLLLLKDKMNTQTGKRIARKRHDFMVLYLNQLFEEI